MKAFWRCVALIGIGWGILMPTFLFIQQNNDRELYRLEKLEGDIRPLSKPYIGASSNAVISVSKWFLERNGAEARSLIGLRQVRSNQYAIAVAVSSVGIIVLSLYIFRTTKK
jgi:hypothetical protein